MPTSAERASKPTLPPDSKALILDVLERERMVGPHEMIHETVVPDQQDTIAVA